MIYPINAPMQDHIDNLKSNSTIGSGYNNNQNGYFTSEYLFVNSFLIAAS